MRTPPNKPEVEPAPSKPAIAKPPDIASASVPDTLAALQVNPDIGLAHAEVDVRRKENGYNEVAEKKGHPILMFLGKFWGLSAWMLELIMVLSAVLGKFSDCGGRRPAGRQRRLELYAGASGRRRRRDASAAVAGQCARPARFEVAGHSRPGTGPGRIVRVRPGDIIPADVKLLTDINSRAVVGGFSWPVFDRFGGR